VDGRPNRRNKASFSNSSGVLWTGLNPEKCYCPFVLPSFVRFNRKRFS